MIVAPGGNGTYAIITPLTDGATTITVQLGGEFELNYNVTVEPETNNSPEGLRTVITAMEPQRGKSGNSEGDLRLQWDRLCISRL